jgi:hypothetical protein
MRDLTPYLMGDPGTSYRRPPSPAEMGKNCQFNKLEYKVRERRVITKTRHRKTTAMNLPIGGWIIKGTKKQAITTMKNMRNYGLSCQCVPTLEGKFQVIRTG